MRHRKGRGSFLFWTSLALFGGARVLAAPIPGLHSTGMDAHGGLLPAGAVDPHWVLVESADASVSGPNAYVVLEGFPIPPWMANGPDSKWIAPQARQSTGHAPGNYIYRTQFVLSGFEPSTASITGRWSSDNAGLDVLLNGKSTGVNYSGEFGAFSEPFIIQSGFVAGTNTLEFVVNNAGSSVNPTGLRVELSGEADPLPPPGTPPSIQDHPESMVVSFKEPATFTVSATGSPPLTYQWRLAAEPLEGATNRTYVVDFSDLAGGGFYDVVVANDFGAVTSRVAVLEITWRGGARAAYEAPGPSSRRTALAITEIMYHPAAQANGRDLEFIEIYNSNPWLEDLSGWRISGSVDFTFPENTRIGGNEYLVVAAEPSDVAAEFGIQNVLGPWDGKLPNGSGTVRLQKRSGAVLLEIRYRDQLPWPTAADGAGHSLVLVRPSRGEGDPNAWTHSGFKNGSPGSSDPVASSLLEAVSINEVVAPTSSVSRNGGYIELYNRSPVRVDLSGCWLSDRPGPGTFRVPANTVVEPFGFVSFAAADLPFTLSTRGSRFHLLTPDQHRVIDAVRFARDVAEGAWGRTPDGSSRWSECVSPTPNSANGPRLVRNVGINEIMFHPLGGDDGQYIELHNSANYAIDLSGWRFVDGIEFTFPAGILINGGSYVVVAKDPDLMMANHPQLNATNCFGPFIGRLSHGGERLALADRSTLVDEVTYGDQSRWSRWADGGGSSLELRDRNSDNRDAANWADSDETGKAEWTVVEQTGVLDLGHPGVPSADQLQIMLMDAGEVLVDDVEVLVSGANRISNPTFESGANGWFAQGTHRASAWAVGVGFESRNAFRMIAADRGDHVANRVRTVLRGSIPQGTVATIRAKVRWQRGRPEILLRLRGGALEAFGTCAVPKNAGTPGARNSRAVVNAGPVIGDVSHFPILPKAGEPIRITAQVHDPDGIDQVLLNYRVDPDSTLVAVPMVDNGSGADQLPADGVYSAMVPPQSTGRLVAFHVVARDAALLRALALFPPNAPAQECLVRVGEQDAGNAFGSYRVWMTRETHDAWARREKMSNENLDATFVYGTNRVIYNIGARYSGSSYTSPGYDSPTGRLCGYHLEFPPGDELLGDNQMTLDWPIRDDTAQREQLMFWFLEQYGLPNMHRRHVLLHVNGIRRGTVYEDAQQPGRDTIREWFPADDDGRLFKTDCWNEFDNSGSRVDPCVLNTLQIFTGADGAKKMARYRWNWRPRAIGSKATDFSDLFELIDAVNATENHTERVLRVVDVDHWMRTFAMNDLASYWDGFGNPNAKNTFLYKPERDGWKLMCWDFDVGLGVFNDPPDARLFDVRDPAIARMNRTPAFVRLYWAALEEAVNGFFQSTHIHPILDAKYAAFRAHGIGLNSPSGIKSWIRERRSYLLSQLATVRAPFAITTNNGADLAADSDSVTLIGTAPVSVRTILVNGVARPVTWTTVLNWKLLLPLVAGTNEFVLQGVDRSGVPMANARSSIRVRFAGPVPPPEILLRETRFIGPGRLQIAWTARAGSRYRVKFKNHLSAREWSYLPSEFIAGASVAQAIDESAGESAHRFYQIEQVP